MVRITQATEHDFTQVRSLFLEFIQWVVPLVETLWVIPIDIPPADIVEHDMADIQKFMPRDGRLFLASDDSGVVGCACARTIRPGLAEIKRVYVRPDGRGSGTGRALIQTIIADLRDAGYTTVRLETAPFMPGAERLYRSLGFKDIAPYDESETPSQFRHHGIYLELSL
jgi:ribosomal protein S18 acetylase RimI-like enzyme